MCMLYLSSQSYIRFKIVHSFALTVFVFAGHIFFLKSSLCPANVSQNKKQMNMVLKPSTKFESLGS